MDGAPSGESLRQKLLRSVSALASIHFVSLGLSFARNLVIAKFIGSYEIGIAAGYSAALTAVEACSEMGLKNAIVQNPNGATEPFVSTVHSIALSRSIGISLILFLSAGVFAHWFKTPDQVLYFRLAALIPLFRGLWHHGIMIEQRSHEFSKQASVELHGQVVAFAVGSLAGIFTHSHLAVFVATFTHNAVMCLSSHLLAPFRYRLEWHPEYVAQLKSFSGPLVIAGTLMFFGTQADRFIIGRTFEPGILGQYALASLLTAVPTQAFARVYRSVFLSLFSSAANARQFALRWRAGLITSLIFGGAFALFFWFIMPPLIRSTYGDEFLVTAQISGLMGLVAAIKVTQFLPNQVAMSSGRSSLVARANLIRAFLIGPQAWIAYSFRDLQIFIVAGITFELVVLVFFFLATRQSTWPIVYGILQDSNEELIPSSEVAQNVKS